MEHQVAFSKSYSSPDELATLLKSRGLLISNDSKAAHYLTHIGYYRLSAYMYPFLILPKENHTYKDGSTFDKVMMLYRFDKKLRLLLFNEIEKIEVAVRSAIVNTCCEMLGDIFWMTNSSNFSNPTKFSRTKQLIDDELTHTREDFIFHFKSKYSDPYPPAWMLAEIMPFGTLTNIYSNLRNKRMKKRIAQSFGLQTAPFESWLTIISVTRNSCCHHARIWNRTFSIRPMIPNHLAYAWVNNATAQHKVYFDICIIKYFLNVVSPGNDFLVKLLALFAEYPEIDLAALGFPNEDWEKEPLWRTL